MPVARSADGQKRRRRCVLLSLTAFTVMSSSFSVSGFFALKSHDRHRDDSTRADGKPGATYHLFYESDVLCGKARESIAQQYRGVYHREMPCPRIPLCRARSSQSERDYTNSSLMSSHFSVWK